MYTAHSAVPRYCYPFSSLGCCESNTVSHTSVVTLFAGLSNMPRMYENPYQKHSISSAVLIMAAENKRLKNQPEKKYVRSKKG